MASGNLWEITDVANERIKDKKRWDPEDADKSEEDLKKDFEECKKAALEGDVEAQLALSFYYLQGVGTEQNPVQAYQWAMKAAEQNNAGAEFCVAACFKEGIGVPQNKEKALYWLQRAANNGLPQAQYLYGSEIELGNVHNPKLKPYDWYKKAADQGHAEAQNGLGMLFQKGYGGVLQSNELAFQWYEKAAWQGLAVAQYNLGYCYYYGIGVKQNETKAIEWIKKSAEQGYETAVETLQNLKYGGLGAITKHCYITTAVCYSLNKNDNCYELQMFRRFRDEWLLMQNDGKAIVEEYYRIAPSIVSEIEKQTDCLIIFKNIWNCYLSKCLSMIENGKYRECKNLYMDMVDNLKRKYINSKSG